jgi:peptidoglycan hydrolase-like protein with peptidoglycan-binding domain
MYRKFAAIAAIALVPALAAAQERDTTRRDTTQRDTVGDIVADTARGRLETDRASRNLGLETNEVRQLQQALNDMGCNAGPVDGIVGPMTRRAVRCARRQHNITGDDLNELFRAMNLDITAEGVDTMMPTDTAGVPRDTSGLPPARDTSGGIRDTTARRDSLMRDTTFRRDTSFSRDTTFRRDTTFGRDSLVRRDSMPPRDTLMRRDTTRTEGDTSRSRRDTTRTP